MAYSVDQLITQFRVQMDDNVKPYLWDEDRIVEWIDEAQKIFAEETHIFQGSEDINVLTSDAGYVDIPSYVIEIRRAKLASQSQPLELRNFNSIDRAAVYSDYGTDLTGDWEALTGTPRILAADVETDKGRLVPKQSTSESYTISSATADTIVMASALDTDKTLTIGSVDINDTTYAYTGYSGSTLTGVAPDPSAETGTAAVSGYEVMTVFYARYPLKDITSSSRSLEITDTRHQRLMVVYARAMAYGDHDADVYDPKQEEAKLAEFFAKTEKIAFQIKRKTRKVGTVKYGGL